MKRGDYIKYEEIERFLTTIGRGNQSDINAHLKKIGSVDAQTESGMTALSVAATDVDLPLVAKLIALGANPNQITRSSQPVFLSQPIFLRLITTLNSKSPKAYLSKLTPIIQFLIKNGADINLSNSPEKTPLSMILQNVINIDAVKILLNAGARITDQNGCLFTSENKEAMDLILREKHARACIADVNRLKLTPSPSKRVNSL